MSEDATFGSYSALPAAPVAPRAAHPGRRPRRRILAGASLIAGAAVLVGLGAAAGASFAGGHGRAAATYPTPPAGPVNPGPPPTALPTGTSSVPELEVAQPFGDGDTVFVVHGSGFVPLTQVLVHLAGHGVARFRPTVDREGTFNYAIDQGHVFFAGPIPAGQYHVLVTGAQDRRATASFSVGPPPPPPATGPAALGRDRPSPSGTGHLTPSPGARLAGRGLPVQGA